MAFSAVLYAHHFRSCQQNLLGNGKCTYPGMRLSFPQPKPQRLKEGSIRLIIAAFLVVLIVTRSGVRTTNSITSEKRNNLDPWKLGYLDIHHLRVGPGVSSFVVMPDGTTMLIDAGDVDLPRTIPRLEKRGHVGLKIRPPYPNASKTTPGWILDYIQEFWPHGREHKLDYALVTHFHADHLGEPGPDSLASKSTNFNLSGLAEVGDKIRIGNPYRPRISGLQIPRRLVEEMAFRWPKKLSQLCSRIREEGVNESRTLLCWKYYSDRHEVQSKAKRSFYGSEPEEQSRGRVR